MIEELVSPYFYLDDNDDLVNKISDIENSEEFIKYLNKSVDILNNLFKETSYIPFDGDVSLTDLIESFKIHFDVW